MLTPPEEPSSASRVIVGVLDGDSRAWVPMSEYVRIVEMAALLREQIDRLTEESTRFAQEPDRDRS